MSKFAVAGAVGRGHPGPYVAAFATTDLMRCHLITPYLAGSLVTTHISSETCRVTFGQATCGTTPINRLSRNVRGTRSVWNNYRLLGNHVAAC